MGASKKDPTVEKLRNVALVGATGAVGRELLKVLERRNFPLASLRCFGSVRSKGKSLPFREKSIPVEALSEQAFQGCDLAIFSAGKKISEHFAPRAIEQGAIVVDNSSAFRLDPTIPLIIPEINASALKKQHRLIASPNCTAAILLMVLAPLHRKVPIKRIVAATYQAASGAGAKAMQELEEETRAKLEMRPYERKVLPHPYAFNLFLHNSPMEETGYLEEESKVISETRKILNTPALPIAVTCVRVPVLRAHSMALNVEFEQPLTPDQAYEILAHAPGVAIVEDRAKNRFPMPIDASGQDLVLCGRIRRDLSQKNTLDFWVVGDQLLKGAALNAVQIAELAHEELF